MTFQIDRDAPSHPDPARARSLGLGVVGAYVLIAGATLLIGLIVADDPVDRGSLDGSVLRWLVDRRTSVLDTISDVLSQLGSTTVIVVGMVGFAAAALSARWWRAAYLIVGGLTVELAVFLTVSFTIDRDRPDLPPIGAVPSTASYPSGHAAAGVVLYAGIAMAVTSQLASHRWRIVMWSVATPLAFGVGASRAYRAVHFPTDVAAGWMIGIACLALMSVALRRADRVPAAPAERRPGRPDRAPGRVRVVDTADDAVLAGSGVDESA